MKIKGFEITEHEKSKRIIHLKIEEEILDKLKVKLPKMRFMFPPMLSLKIEKN